VTDKESRRRFEAAFRDHFDDVLAYALSRAGPRPTTPPAAPTTLATHCESHFRKRAQVPRVPPVASAKALLQISHVYSEHGLLLEGRDGQGQMTEAALGQCGCGVTVEVRASASQRTT
jgi:hypothetical protein